MRVLADHAVASLKRSSTRGVRWVIYTPQMNDLKANQQSTTAQFATKMILQTCSAVNIAAKLKSKLHLHLIDSLPFLSFVSTSVFFSEPNILKAM